MLSAAIFMQVGNPFCARLWGYLTLPNLRLNEKTMKRRDFLKSSAVVSASMMMPAFLRGQYGLPGIGSRSGKILVVIQLSGGNDGLNTVVPFQNDLYYRERPTLAIPKTEVLTLNDELGLHPAMGPLRDLYDRGELSIVNSVGYPNPDRSHFRSMDIWHTASSSKEYWSTGWLGRYLDSECTDKPAYHALEVDDGLSLAMKGVHKSGFAMSDAKRIRNAANIPYLQAAAKHHHTEEENVAYLYKTLTDTQQSAEYLYAQSRVHRSGVDYPGTKFAKGLKQISELITADTATQVYYISLGGFDTHAFQKNKQQRLLKQYAEAVKSFTDDLKQNGLFNDVLIMTFSEFGRRVKQNASGGTDHGTANNVFLIGGKLKKAGFYNGGPLLSKLDAEDLIYEIDFRRIYADLLNGWLDADADLILKTRFSGLGIV
jgi:uncharacterized protein (DUF1501 family)